MNVCTVLFAQRKLFLPDLSRNTGILVFITLQFLVKSINLLPIIAVNESAHVAKQEPSAFEILALDGIYCRRRIDGGRQRDKKVNLSHVLAGTCRKLIHRRVRVSRCELLTQGQLEVIGMHD